MFRLYKQSGIKTLVASASTTPKLPILPPLIILSALFLLEVLSTKFLRYFPSCTTEGVLVSLADQNMNFHPVSFHSLWSNLTLSLFLKFEVTITHIIYACLGGFIVVVSRRFYEAWSFVYHTLYSLACSRFSYENG